MSRLAVLAYHRVEEPATGGWETWFSVDAQTFAAQLDELGSSGWEVIDLEGLLAGLATQAPLPARAALITFDDAYRSIRDTALSELRSRGYPGVVFAPTGFIGGTNGFDAGCEPDAPICGWDDLAALERAGLSVQSHGVSHRPLSELRSDDRADELRRSKATLEAGLEKRVDAFAYPYGDGGPAPGGLAAEVAAAGYRAAFLYGGGAVHATPPDRYRITRLAMGPDTDLAAELERA